jgi:hypothetical protein
MPSVSSTEAEATAARPMTMVVKEKCILPELYRYYDVVSRVEYPTCGSE